MVKNGLQNQKKKNEKKDAKASKTETPAKSTNNEGDNTIPEDDVPVGDNAEMLEQMKAFQITSLEAVENDDYETFKANMLETYNFTIQMPLELSEELMKELEPFNASLQPRVEAVQDRMEEWAYTAIMELIEEGAIDISQMQQSLIELSDEGLVMYHVEQLCDRY